MRCPGRSTCERGNSVPDDVVDSRISRHPARGHRRHHVHLGHDWLTEGCAAPTRDVDPGTRCADDRLHLPDRGPLPRDSALLPHLRLQGRLDGELLPWSHRHSAAGFDADDVLRKIEAERISILLGPPTVFSDLMSHPGRQAYDLSSLRVTMASAATVPVELIHQLRKDMGFEVVLTSYGLTEAHSAVSTSSCRGLTGRHCAVSRAAARRCGGRHRRR